LSERINISLVGDGYKVNLQYVSGSGSKIRGFISKYKQMVVIGNWWKLKISTKSNQTKEALVLELQN